MSLIDYTKQFAEAKTKQTPTGTQIGTLSISIPTRRKFIDRKGRKRRVAVKYEMGLTQGPGALTGRSLISNLKKDMAGVKSKPIDQKLYRKIIAAFKAKQ